MSSLTHTPAASPRSLIIACGALVREIRDVLGANRLAGIDIAAIRRCITTGPKRSRLQLQSVSPLPETVMSTFLLPMRSVARRVILIASSKQPVPSDCRAHIATPSFLVSTRLLPGMMILRHSFLLTSLYASSTA